MTNEELRKILCDDALMKEAAKEAKRMMAVAEKEVSEYKEETQKNEALKIFC